MEGKGPAGAAESGLPVIALLWPQFGAYHVDRGLALAAALEGVARVVGIEIAPRSAVYAWERPALPDDFEILTLFPDRAVEAVGVGAEVRGVLAAVRRARVRHLFISGYERPASFLIALLCRLIGVRAHVFLDSKFDDKPRRLPLELLKSVMMLPYRTGFAAGPRAEAYLRFLGLRRRPVAQGYDTVSLARMRALAPASPMASGIAWAERPFLIVARFVPKKNLAFALEAFALYRARGGGRDLVLCGSGPLEAELRARAGALGISGAVAFRGFCAQPEVAAAMASALCLLIPSVEEQWGLVVNEALAFDLPILAAPGVGAAELLVRPLVNGHVLDIDEHEGWARAMLDIGEDEALWTRLCAGSRRLAPRGDVRAFVAAVETLTGVRAAPRGARPALASQG